MFCHFQETAFSSEYIVTAAPSTKHATECVDWNAVLWKQNAGNMYTSSDLKPT